MSNTKRSMSKRADLSAPHPTRLYGLDNTQSYHRGDTKVIQYVVTKATPQFVWVKLADGDHVHRERRSLAVRPRSGLTAVTTHYGCWLWTTEAEAWADHYAELRADIADREDDIRHKRAKLAIAERMAQRMGRLAAQNEP